VWARRLSVRWAAPSGATSGGGGKMGVPIFKIETPTRIVANRCMMFQQRHFGLQLWAWLRSINFKISSTVRLTTKPAADGRSEPYHKTRRRLSEVSRRSMLPVVGDHSTPWCCSSPG
jgi:hypothetical protein